MLGLICTTRTVCVGKIRNKLNSVESDMWDHRHLWEPNHPFKKKNPKTAFNFLRVRRGLQSSTLQTQRDDSYLQAHIVKAPSSPPRA
jgi:hypothetical protein